MVEDSTREERYWYGDGLWHILSTLSVTGYDVSEGTNGMDITLQVQLKQTHAQHLLEERAEYLQAVQSEPPTTEDVVENLVGDVARALDVTYNRVGESGLTDGLYVKTSDTQWRKQEPESLYDDYSDLLWEFTDRGNGEEYGSIPKLRQPFLEACAESDEHEIPPEGAVNDILREHFRAVRHERESRAAVSKLKRELEEQGIDARTAASVAQRMDDYLVSDAELAPDGDN